MSSRALDLWRSWWAQRAPAPPAAPVKLPPLSGDEIEQAIIAALRAQDLDTVGRLLVMLERLDPQRAAGARAALEAGLKLARAEAALRSTEKR